MNKTEKEFDSLIDVKFNFKIKLSKIRELWKRKRKEKRHRRN
jgi:hypothetical protein